ncbi:MAG TPA: CPBP family intramembrane metalloprotease [Spirochaetes bacterium]|nr:CPBP family intramembrane metalloprotease [Spirochaetota bacterium]
MPAETIKTILRFFGLTYLISWTPWLSAVALGLSTESPFGVACVAVGGIGPAAAAVIMLRAYGDSTARQDYLRRLRPGLIGPAWYGLIFLLPVLFAAAAVFISLPFGGTLRQLVPLEKFLENPLSLLSFALFVLFFGPVTEELGWRGYGLDALRNRFNGLTASLVLAAAWALWHVPLFFIEGYPLREMALGPVQLAGYFSDFFPKCVIYTWIFYRTGRSTLSAILFHFMSNYTGMVIEIGPLAEGIQVAALYGFAVIVVFANRRIFFGNKLFR